MVFLLLRDLSALRGDCLPPAITLDENVGEPLGHACPLSVIAAGEYRATRDHCGVAKHSYVEIINRSGVDLPIAAEFLHHLRLGQHVTRQINHRPIGSQNRVDRLRSPSSHAFTRRCSI